MQKTVSNNTTSITQ